TKDIIRNIFIENGLGKYGIFLNEKLIGTIYFLNLDDRNKSAELSYVLNKNLKGMATQLKLPSNYVTSSLVNLKVSACTQDTHLTI
ncbi:GNAT family acetyltransferase, partial [Lacticaseibacillus rhamnosus MTCC 5462]